MERNFDEKGYYEYSLIQNNLKFKMYYGGNLDIYWEIQNMDVDAENFESYEEKPLEFVIEPQYYEAYSIFFKLLRNVKSSAKKMQDEAQRAKREKMEEEDVVVYVNDDETAESYELIVKDGVVVWYSDEDSIENANFVTLTQVNGNILVTFRKGNMENDFPGSIPIRFRNSGSRYNPFNKYFMECFSDIGNIFPGEKINNPHMRKLTNNQ